MAGRSPVATSPPPPPPPSTCPPLSLSSSQVLGRRNLGISKSVIVSLSLNLVGGAIISNWCLLLLQQVFLQTDPALQKITTADHCLVGWTYILYSYLVCFCPVWCGWVGVLTNMYKKKRFTAAHVLIEASVNCVAH